MIPAILLLFTLFYVCAFCASVLFAPSRFSWLNRPRLLAWILAVLGSLAVLGVTAVSPFWSRSTQIAWTGLETEATGSDLRVGGGDQAVVGWPNGAFEPSIRFLASQPGQIEITGGAGFVKHPDGSFLNGNELPLGVPVRVREFVVEVQRRWFFGRQVSVRRASDNEELSDFPASSPDRDRVIDMEVAVNPDIVQLRAVREGAKAAELERWANGLRLLIPEKGNYRVLDRSGPSTRTAVPVDGRVIVHWASGSLPLALHVAPGNRLAVDFLPPWRLASPLPPSAADGQAQITVTGQLAPGDTALLLPFGSALAGFRRDLPLELGRFAQCGQQDPDNPFSPQLPSERTQTWRGVTCVQGVPTGKAIVRLATVRDLPNVRQGMLMLVLAWITFGMGLYIALQRMREADLWTICGIVTTIWMLLVYRAQLAIRYAADPAYLDPLAVGGFTRAMIALTVVPGVILLVAPMWRDQHFTFRAGGQKPYVRLAFLGLALAIGAVIQTISVGSLWPNLPPSYFIAGGASGIVRSVVIAAALFLAFLFYLSFLYFLDPTTLPLTPRLRAIIEASHEFTHTSWNLLRTTVTVPGFQLWQSMQRHGGSSSSGPVSLRWSGSGSQPISRGFWWWYRLIFGWVGALLVLLPLVVLYVSGTAKYIQEIVAPLLLCWVPAVLLLSARMVFTPGGGPRISTGRAVVVITTMVFVAVFVFPFAVIDVGGIVATISVFLPAATLLLLGRRHWPIVVVPISVLFAAVVLAVIAYMQVNVVVNPLSQLSQTGSARLLIWKHGVNIQEYLPWARVAKAGDAPLPVSFRKLSEAMEHSTENKMMAHEGRFSGLGFANAPTRLSKIRQDTLQYDSTFAFFVVGDDGWLGGMCLLLLYAVPLGLILVSGKSLFDVGHGVATLVGSAFLMAALFHAGMNLGNLPFTGRNLPLLSVNSGSDLLLWTVLFAFAIQAVLWRVTGHATDFDAHADSILNSGTPGGPEPPRRYMVACAALVSFPAMLLIWNGWTGIATIRDASLDDGMDWSRLLEEVDGMVAKHQLWFDKSGMKIVTDRPIPSDSLIGQEIEAFNSLSDDEKLEGALPLGPSDFRQRLRQVRSLSDYDQLMAELRALDVGIPRRRPNLFALSEPDLWADMEETIRNFDAEYRLSSNPAYNSRTSFRSGTGPEDYPGVSLRDGVVGQWVLRGQGLSISFGDRVAGPADAREVTVWQVKSGLSLVKDTNPSASRGVLWLRFYPVDKAGATTAVATTRQFGRAEVRKDGLYFAPEQLDLDLLRKGQLPAKQLKRGIFEKVEAGDILTSRGQLNKDFRPALTAEHNRRGALVGAAWVRGRWTMAYDSDPLVPWSRHLAFTLANEWRALGPQEATKRYGALSLDRGLQGAAQEFVATQGRQRHQQLLAARGSREALPPRVALSILDLPSGEVLALGGWPRMNSGRQWLTGPNGDIPSVDWVEDHAPRSLRRRYAGDRNFDRMMMGSATKPILASAALAVHKNLNQQLAVKGSAGRENEVFGIPLIRPWHVPTSVSLDRRGWTDFKSYLAKSDNRYHIRLGFLALADPDEQYQIASSGRSPSQLESMDGGSSPWQRYPRFADYIGFGPQRPNAMRRLQDSPFAAKLSSIFGIGIQRGDVSRRYSLWTGNEEDDRPARTEAERRRQLRFSALAPEAPQFAFDRIDHPRTYVSLLLGGDENLWANVEFAAAFATSVQGLPISAHLTRGPVTESLREKFPEIARKLRPGLEAVIEHADGTAHGALTQTGALPLLHSLSGYKLYGKTGTLAESDERSETSRFVITIVRQDDSGKFRKGLALSLVVERGQMGMAARMLGAFIVRYWDQIRARLT